MLYLKNKLPLTKSLIRKHDIPPTDNFKYYILLEGLPILHDQFPQEN